MTTTAPAETAAPTCPAVRLTGRRVRTARGALHWYVYRPAVERARDTLKQHQQRAHQDAVAEVNYVSDLLDRISWPGTKATPALVVADEIPTLRRAAFEQLASYANAPNDASLDVLDGIGKWEPARRRGTVENLIETVRLLDLLGWTE